MAALGWVDELRPLTASQPLALLPTLGTTVVLAGLAIVLAGSRDLGASILPTSDTAPAHTRLLAGPLGLAWRLGRGSAAGWIAGLGASELILGLSTKTMQDVWANQSGGVFARLGGSTYVGLVFLVNTMLVATAAAGQVAATREEEAEGYLDHLLARPANPMKVLACGNRRQSPTSAASVSAPSRVTPRSAASRATCQPNGGRSYQPARSPSMASSCASRLCRTAR